MASAKKAIYIPGDNKIDAETKRFNKRALIGSIIIHLFFMLIRLPHLELEHKLKEDPKLIPIKMTSISSTDRELIKSSMLKNKLITSEETKTPVVSQEKKVENGTDQVVKNSKSLGDPLASKVQDVQKGDPRSNIKKAYVPGTDVRKLAKNSIGTGSAKGSKPAKDGNTGGSGDTYKGADMTNLTNSLLKSGKGLKRLRGGKNPDDGGAGSGTGGGMGDGEGGGSGNGHFTGSTTGTANTAKIATNVGSLTGSAKGKIDSSKGFDGLATKGSVMVAGMPAEKVAVSIINPDEIRRLLREHIPQFRYCYQNELDSSRDPNGLSGRVDFRFKIGGTGRVTNSEINSEKMTSDKVRDCIRDVLHGIQFPAPAGGKTVEVFQPMNFYPKRI